MAEGKVSGRDILIIDDDEKIVGLLSSFLERNGFSVSGAGSVPEAKKIMEGVSFGLIILDVMLPEVSGIDFAKSLRESKNATPVIMLTALSAPEDRVGGLEAGANDYLVKPFEPKELLIRVKNLIESHKKTERPGFSFGDWTYEPKSKTLSRSGEITKIGSAESKLLEKLLESAGRPIERGELSYFLKVAQRSVDVLISRLREKIESRPKNPRHLKTIRGKGYAFFV